MHRFVQLALRVGVTLVLGAAAAAAGHSLWQSYRLAPWTRDGRIRADVVQVAPDVSGLVDRVLVHDNQVVRQGDILFTVDGERYRWALSQAEGGLRALRVQIEQAEREATRSRALGDIVAAEQREQSVSKVQQLGASIVQATAAAETARINLERTQVRAPVDGWITNFELRPGSYATAGRPLLALVDSRSLHAVGYFEETKVPRIHIGDAVRVRMLGDTHVLAGHVQGIAAAIEDRERQGSSNLLANVNPTFNWVRLAQRIPVRIQLDEVPPEAQLIMGRTATIDVVGHTSGAATTLGAR
jgi:RND family efflux transporter MFP subunit